MNTSVTNVDTIQDKIYNIRDMQVMLDRDLAELYGVETKRINEAVKRNQDRFPNDLMFEISDMEFEILRSQNATANFAKVRANPKVFTEQGVYMLATVLKSKIATEVTLSIMRTFVRMKHFLSQNKNLFQKIDQIEKRQLSYEIKTDEKIDKIFKAIEDKSIKPKQGIFFDGQIFDAYEFVADLIKSAKEKIVLIDNYIDETVLTLFSKNQDIKVTIYTKSISKQLKLDLEKYNSQYTQIEIKKFDISHDRFLIIDENEVYHIGASLKDLGKKWFAFSKMDIDNFEMFKRLK
jgi:hypothetical protein